MRPNPTGSAIAAASAQPRATASLPFSERRTAGAPGAACRGTWARQLDGAIVWKCRGTWARVTMDGFRLLALLLALLG
jgi:hypothetical protein